MKTSELVFIGIRGSVIALDRATGNQAWATKLKGYDFVNVVFQDDSILATTHGEVFCLDPLNGTLLWHNGLKGYGFDLATIATDRAASSGNLGVLAEKRRRAQAASSSAATASS